MSITLGILGIICTIYIFYLQKQRGRFEIDLDIEKNPFNSKNRNSVYANQDAEWEINVTTKVKSNYSKPIFIDSFFIAVPKIQWFYKPYWISIYWPSKRFIPIELSGLKLPKKLEPEGELDKQFITGLEIATTLSEKDYKNKMNVLIGFFDENKNAYFSNPFPVDIEEWNKDRGNSYATFLV